MIPYLFVKPKSSGSECLHYACTHDIDRKVCRYALELNNTALFAKLAPADMIALELKYTKCLAGLYNRARIATSSTSGKGNHGDLYRIPFAELVTYVCGRFSIRKKYRTTFKLCS